MPFRNKELWTCSKGDFEAAEVASHETVISIPSGFASEQREHRSRARAHIECMTLRTTRCCPEDFSVPIVVLRSAKG